MQSDQRKREHAFLAMLVLNKTNVCFITAFIFSHLLNGFKTENCETSVEDVGGGLA